MAHSYDTFTHSSETSATPIGYRSERRQQQIVCMDEFLLNLEILNRSSTQRFEETSDNELITSAVTTDTLQVSLAGSDNIRDNSNTQYCEINYSTDTSTQGSSYYERMLRFPLSRIMEDHGTSRLLPLTRPREQSTKAASGNAHSSSDDSSLSHLWNDQQSPRRALIGIEEISLPEGMEAPQDILRNEAYYIQLAQSTSVKSGEAPTMDQAVVLPEWWEGAGVWDFTSMIVASEELSSCSEISISQSSQHTINVLEILTTPSLARSSDSDDSSGERNDENVGNPSGAYLRYSLQTTITRMTPMIRCRLWYQAVLTMDQIGRLGILGNPWM